MDAALIYVFTRKPFTRRTSENITNSEEREQGDRHPRGHLDDCLNLVKARFTGELSDPGGFMGSDIFLFKGGREASSEYTVLTKLPFYPSENFQLNNILSIQTRLDLPKIAYIRLTTRITAKRIRLMLREVSFSSSLTILFSAIN